MKKENENETRTRWQVSVKFPRQGHHMGFTSYKESRLSCHFVTQSVSQCINAERIQKKENSINSSVFFSPFNIQVSKVQVLATTRRSVTVGVASLLSCIFLAKKKLKPLVSFPCISLLSHSFCLFSSYLVYYYLLLLFFSYIDRQLILTAFVCIGSGVFSLSLQGISYPLPFFSWFIKRKKKGQGGLSLEYLIHHLQCIDWFLWN